MIAGVCPSCLQPGQLQYRQGRNSGRWGVGPTLQCRCGWKGHTRDLLHPTDGDQHPHRAAVWHDGAWWDDEVPA